MASVNSKRPRVVGIIPARYASTRLPGKPLVLIGGKPMIQWVCEQVRKASVLDAVLVATDDDRIAAAVSAFGGELVMTLPTHPSGTDRLAEAARKIEADIIVNIQGDQPFMDPGMIQEAVQPLLDDPNTHLSTLKHPIQRPLDLTTTSVVKVVTDRAGFALYFSRSLIPYPQKPVEHRVFQHVGLYVYRKATLLEIDRKSTRLNSSH